MNELNQKQTKAHTGIIAKIKQKLFRAKKWLSVVAQFSGLATFITLAIVIKINFFSDAIIQCKNFAKYQVGKVAVYQGELVNTSSIHANGVTLKGKFNSDIYKLDVDTSDLVEAPKLNGTSGAFEFSLRRLSKGNRCLFTVIAAQRSEITDQLYVSWENKGSLQLSLNKADPVIQKALDLGGDLSQKARIKWIENNTRNIKQ